MLDLNGILQGLRVAQAAGTQFFFVKKNKNYQKNVFFCIYLLVMPEYWGKQIFSLGSFPEVDQKQNTERKEKKRKRDWPMVITMASYLLQRHLGWRTQSRLGQYTPEPISYPKCLLPRKFPHFLLLCVSTVSDAKEKNSKSHCWMAQGNVVNVKWRNNFVYWWSGGTDVYNDLVGTTPHKMNKVVYE